MVNGRVGGSVQPEPTRAGDGAANSATGWPVIEPGYCQVPADTVRERRCQPGQGEFGKFFVERAAAGLAECGAHCLGAEGCEAFDYASNDPTARDACRLYTVGNKPRLGDGGGHNREYCALVAVRPCSGKSVVVFSATVYNSSKPARAQAQNTALESWRQLSPRVCTLGHTDTVAMKRGLAAHRILGMDCPTNANGLPYFGRMLQAAERQAVAVGSKWAGFSNGDIGYDDSLPDTLARISAEVVKGSISGKVLVIGQRCNVRANVAGAATAGGAAQQQQLATICGGHNATGWRRAITVEKAALHDTSAEDYFFFRPGTIPWSGFPSFVIGRPGFDNIFVQWMLSEGVTVIDATESILAMHFMTGGAKDGWVHRDDKYWNFCALLHATSLRREGPWGKYGDTCDKCNYGYIDQVRAIRAVRPRPTPHPTTT